MGKKSGFSKLTDSNKVDAKCVVTYEYQHKKEFDEFAVVGFDNGEQEAFCYTALDIRDLYKAILMLQDVFENALQQLPEEEQKEIRAEAMLECAEEWRGWEEEDGE